MYFGTLERKMHIYVLVRKNIPQNKKERNLSMNARNTRSECDCSENKERNCRNSMNSREDMNNRSNSNHHGNMDCQCNMTNRGVMNHHGDMDYQCNMTNRGVMNHHGDMDCQCNMTNRGGMNNRGDMNCRCNRGNRGNMNYGGERNCQGGCSQGRCGMSNEEMERVMQRCENDSAQRGCDSLYGMHLAMGYVPWQEWGKTYEPAEGIGCGTIFPELNLPFLGCVPRDCGCGARRGGRA